MIISCNREVRWGSSRAGTYFSQERLRDSLDRKYTYDEQKYDDNEKMWWSWIWGLNLLLSSEVAWFNGKYMMMFMKIMMTWILVTMKNMMIINMRHTLFPLQRVLCFSMESIVAKIMMRRRVFIMMTMTF